jgi:hypothetical protein
MVYVEAVWGTLWVEDTVMANGVKYLRKQRVQK